MLSLLGHDAPCGLACALCAETARSDNPGRDAEEIARGDEPPAEDGTVQIFPHRFEVKRRDLAGASRTAIVGRIMEGVWKIEERLCAEAVSRLPEHQVTPRLAGMIEQGRLEEFLAHANAEREFGELDTAIVGNDMLRRICRSCPGLAAVEAHSGILRHGPLTVLAHAGFTGQTVLLSSIFGPALVHGPTAVRCHVGGLDIRHYCRVADLRSRRLSWMAGGVRFVPQGAP